jgi:curved DNA-binding protein CbpA
MLGGVLSGADDHYEALDVASDASTAEIHTAWRFRLVAFHPDRFRDPDQRQRAEELTKRANAAWQVLGDPTARRRYDRIRAGDGARPAPPRPTLREIPCPSCASRMTVADAGGEVVEVRCVACGESFPAMIGARCIGRPRLDKRTFGLRYLALFAGPRGERHSVSFRRLPPELALSEGELFTIVFHPRRGHPVYAIVHGEALDVGWRVR